MGKILYSLAVIVLIALINDISIQASEIIKLDSDGDGILDDGDYSGVAGDNPCIGGVTVNCDDNCPETYNPNQADKDSDGVGNVCCCDVPGDADNSGGFNILDITFLVNYLYKGGPEPPCLDEADLNGDCEINVLDISRIIWLLYKCGKCGETPVCGCAEQNI